MGLSPSARIAKPQAAFRPRDASPESAVADVDWLPGRQKDNRVWGATRKNYGGVSFDDGSARMTYFIRFDDPGPVAGSDLRWRPRGAWLLRAAWLGGLAAIALLATATGGRADIAADFNGGNSTSVVDAYPGAFGDGWTTPWTLDAARSTATVSAASTAPLSTGGGNYLGVDIRMDAGVTDANYGQACVARLYSSSYTDFAATAPHTIHFQVRIDEDMSAGGTFTSDLDRYYFFDNPTLTNGTRAENSWSIFAFGAAAGTATAKSWALYNGLRDGGSFDTSRFVDTGVPLVSGRTYDFTINVDPPNRSYAVSLFDGTTTHSYAGLGFRTASYEVGRYLHFGGKGNRPAESRAFSLDAVSIEANGATPPDELPTADGFHGIWYYNQSIGAPYYYKYSGGFATYPQQLRPQAYYSAEADKTFFVYGGTNPSNSTLYHMISYYDHATGQVARPRILLDKGTTDAHDNPTIMLDDEGYVFIFSPAHGTTRPAYIHRSREPYSISQFDQVLALPPSNNFSYAQPAYVEGRGFLFLHTFYSSIGRTLCFNTSADGVHWDYDWATRPKLTELPGGQYQVSEVHGQTVGMAFNYLPGNVANARTNLYYMQTTDFGRTWTTADGTTLTTPVTTVDNLALVHDYKSEGKLVYLKEVDYDAKGQPVIMYLTSSGWEPGPENGPRTWHFAHFDEGQWEIKPLRTSEGVDFTTDHNYDFGPLTIEADGTWRIIAPTDPGPQAWSTGGEMEMWVSHDEGDTWQRIRQLTHGSQFDHTYARQPVGADEGFYALWADGNPLAKSTSRLYFTDRLGTGVWRLPESMEGDFATPELAFTPIGAPGPGDANGDGRVDAEDAAALAAHWLTPSGATWSEGDFNRDGRVDDLDASILAAHWLYTPDSPAVPEPGLLALLAGAAVCLLARRRGA